MDTASTCLSANSAGDRRDTESAAAADNRPPLSARINLTRRSTPARPRHFCPSSLAGFEPLSHRARFLRAPAAHRVHCVQSGALTVVSGGQRAAQRAMSFQARLMSPRPVSEATTTSIYRPTLCTPGAQERRHRDQGQTRADRG